MSFTQNAAEVLPRELRWRNIGPANLSGRVVDIEAVESDFRQVFVAAAVGGALQSGCGVGQAVGKMR